VTILLKRKMKESQFEFQQNLCSTIILKKINEKYPFCKMNFD